MKTLQPINPDISSDQGIKEGSSTSNPELLPSSIPDPIDYHAQQKSTFPKYTSPKPTSIRRKINILSILLNIVASLMLIAGVVGFLGRDMNGLAIVLLIVQSFLGIGLLLRWSIARYLTIVLTGLNLVLLFVGLSSLIAFNPEYLIGWTIQVCVYLSVLILLTLPSIKQQF